jgi:hypothetical protein
VSRYTLFGREIALDLTVVTRNVADMENSGVRLLNLWE